MRAPSVVPQAVLLALLPAVLLAGCGSAAGTPAAAPQPTATVAGVHTQAPELSPAPTLAPLTGGRPGPGAAAPEAAQAPELNQAPAFRPDRLTLPSGRGVPVRPAGVDAAGALQVPDDPAQAGWWTGGALAGEPYGSVVIAGHVDSERYGLGALVELASVRPGQTVTLSLAGRRLSYRIEAIRRVPRARLAAGTDSFRPDGPPRLVLLTCGGPYDHAAHSYRDNVVVTATPVGA